MHRSLLAWATIIVLLGLWWRTMTTGEDIPSGWGLLLGSLWGALLGIGEGLKRGKDKGGEP